MIMARDHSVGEFNLTTSQHSDEVFSFLEDHVDQVRELSISDGLLGDEDVPGLDDLLRVHHADVQLQSLKLRNNSLTSRSSSSLANIVHTTQTLVELDLSDNQVKADGLLQIKHSLCETCCTLTRLNLSNNKLGAGGALHIASIVGHNRSITELLVSKNDFGKKSLKTLCKKLAENDVLQKLDLSFNKISSGGAFYLAPVLDPTVSHSRLQHIDLTHNPIGDTGIQYIAGALLEGNNKSLRHLNLTRTQFSAEGAIFLANLLKYSYTLEELIISRNKIGFDGVWELCRGIQDSRNENGSVLKLFDLEMAMIDDQGAEKLAEMLKGNDTIERLNLADNDIQSDGAKSLADALHSNQVLRDLDLQRNQIRDSGAIALSESLCRPSCPLKTLGWKKNPISELGQERLMAAFKFRENKRIWLNSVLSEIENRRHMAVDLLHREVSDEEVIAICNHVSNYHPRIPIIGLSGPSITARSMKVLAKDLLVNANVNIHRIHLRRTSIGDMGAAAFAQALYSNNMLRVLSLQKSQISSEGIKFLSRAVAKMSSLYRIDLSSNQIADDGAKEFFETILDPPHPSLSGVSLAGNLISDATAFVIRSFGNLDTLDISFNRLSDVGALDLAKAATRGLSKLRILDVSHNSISKKGIAALELFVPEDKLLNHGQKPTNGR